MRISDLKMIIPLLFALLGLCRTFPKPLHKGGICTGFKASFSHAQYLEQFNKGPCSPLILVPGLMGSGLIVRANCPVLREAAKFDNDAKIAMDICSFMCGADQDVYENMIWLTQKSIQEYVTSSDFNFVWKNRECGSFLFSVKKKSRVNASGGNSKIEDYEVPGIKVKVFGDSQETKGESQCGRKSITSFAGEKLTLYGHFFKNLDNLGYVSGLTVQALPYDFRRRATRNGFVQKFKLSLKIIKYLTNKRSVVLGHSYGNNMVMNGLKGLTVKEKDSLVREYFAVGAPFLGSLEGLFFFFGNSSFFEFNVLEFMKWDWLNSQFNGISPFYAKQIYPYIDALYEFVPQLNQIKGLLEKVKGKQKDFELLGIPNSFFDKVLDDAEFFANNSVLTQKIEKDKKEAFSLSEINEMMSKYSISEFSEKYLKQFDFDRESMFKNPETRTRVILLSELDTSSEMVLKSNPRKDFDQNHFPKRDLLKRKGDQTVNLFSLALPPLVWINQYIKKVTTHENTYGIKVDSPRRVKIVEFGAGASKKESDVYEYIQCKDHNDWDDIAKKKEDEKAKNKKKSFWGFVGKGVKSLKGFFDTKKEKKDSWKTQKKKFGYGTCTHGNIIVNKQFILYFNDVLYTRDLQKDEGHSVKFKEDVLEQIIFQCLPVTCDRELSECWDQFLDLLSRPNSPSDEQD